MSSDQSLHQYDDYGEFSISFDIDPGENISFITGGEYEISGGSSAINVAKVTFALLICILGLFGNVLVMFVILALKDNQKSPTHRYVLQLAISDSIFLLTVPFMVSEDIQNGWIYPEWLCKLKEAILYLNYYASMLFLTIMSIDRYVAVCHSLSELTLRLRKPKAAVLISVLTWGVSLLLCIPVLLYSFKIGVSPHCKCSHEFPGPLKNDTERCYESGFTEGLSLEKCLLLAKVSANSTQSSEVYCRKPSDELYKLIFGDMFMNFDMPFNNLTSANYSSEFFYVDDSNGSRESAVNVDTIAAECNYFGRPGGWVAFIAFNFVVMFLLPLLVMLLCYGLIVRRILTMRVPATRICRSTADSRSQCRNMRSAKQGIKSTLNTDRDRRRVTMMCGSLVLCFVACWLPFQSVHLAKIAGIKVPPLESRICTVLHVAGILLAYLNSALNPFLYSFLGSGFSERLASATNSIRGSLKRKKSSSIKRGIASPRNTEARLCKSGRATTKLL